MYSFGVHRDRSTLVTKMEIYLMSGSSTRLPSILLLTIRNRYEPLTISRSEPTLCSLLEFCSDRD